MQRQTAIVSLHVLAFAVACAASSGRGNPVSPSPATLGEPFNVKAGGSVTIRDENLRVGFDRVLSDSRCPRGARCIAQGEATVRVWLLKAARGRAAHELQTTPPSAAEAVYDGYRIRLTALDPYPEVDRPVRSSDYVVTLVVTRSQTSP